MGGGTFFPLEINGIILHFNFPFPIQSPYLHVLYCSLYALTLSEEITVWPWVQHGSPRSCGRAPGQDDTGSRRDPQLPSLPVEPGVAQVSKPILLLPAAALLPLVCVIHLDPCHGICGAVEKDGELSR